MPIYTSNGAVYDDQFDQERSTFIQEQFPFDTPLSVAEEKDYYHWKQKYAPNDSGADYDLRGAYKSGLTPDTETGHWPDTYKKPNHPTFSDQSIYADRGMPGQWAGDQFIPPTPNREENFMQGKEMIRQEYLKNTLDPQADEEGPFYYNYNDQPTPHAQTRILNSGPSATHLRDLESEFEYNQALNPRTNPRLREEEGFPQNIQNISDKKEEDSLLGGAALGTLMLVPRYRNDYSDPGYRASSDAFNRAFTEWRTADPSTRPSWREFTRQNPQAEPPKIPIKEGESGYYSIIHKETGKSAGFAELDIRNYRSGEFKPAGKSIVHVNMIRSDEDASMLPKEGRLVTSEQYDKISRNLSATAKNSNYLNQSVGVKEMKSLLREVNRIWPGSEIEGYRVSGVHNGKDVAIKSDAGVARGSGRTGGGGSAPNIGTSLRGPARGILPFE